LSPLVIVTVIAAVAAAAASAFAFRERGRRHEAERRVAAMTGDAEAADEARARAIGIIAHELRSPVSVVLGYQELISDGIYGRLDERGQDALTRIRHAVEQQLRVLEGAVELAGAGKHPAGGAAPVELAALFRAALADARVFGLAYNVSLETEPPADLPVVIAPQDRIRRALDMSLAAAVKASPGRTLVVTVAAVDGGADVTISGAGLDPARDDPGGVDGRPITIASGAALRLAIARNALRAGTGSLSLAGESDAATLDIRVRGQPRSD
jgi:two-component system, OmpR family, sensor kinase